jgi:hypothetical protein
MKVIGSYNNGNYRVSIFDDGTKVRENKLDFFRADFPESMDIKITNSCDMGCLMCHENSVKNGKHGDIMNLEFIDRLHPYTELAIGGGNPLEHPNLIPFLKKCKVLKLIPSITINQIHFQSNMNLVREMVNEKLIYGLGVSVMNITDEFIAQLKEFPNAVIHVIAGLVDIEDLLKLSKNNFKVLILGYKVFRRGADLYTKHSAEIEAKITSLKNELPEILEENWFDVVSFDNLALDQLCVKNILSKEDWEQFFMGNDGFATMYVDCVEENFSRSSTSVERYSLKDNIVDMFSVIRVNS